MTGVNGGRAILTENGRGENDVAEHASALTAPDFDSAVVLLEQQAQRAPAVVVERIPISGGFDTVALSAGDAYLALRHDPVTGMVQANFGGPAWKPLTSPGSVPLDDAGTALSWTTVDPGDGSSPSLVVSVVSTQGDAWSMDADGDRQRVATSIDADQLTIAREAVLASSTPVALASYGSEEGGGVTFGGPLAQYSMFAGETAPMLVDGEGRGFQFVEPAGEVALEGTDVRLQWRQSADGTLQVTLVGEYGPLSVPAESGHATAHQDAGVGDDDLDRLIAQLTTSGAIREVPRDGGSHPAIDFVLGAAYAVRDNAMGAWALLEWGSKTLNPTYAIADPHGFIEHWESNAEFMNALRSDPTGSALAMWDGMTAGVVDAWARGDKAEAMGYATASIGMLFMDGAGLAKLGTSAKAAGLVRTIDDVPTLVDGRAGQVAIGGVDDAALPSVGSADNAAAAAARPVYRADDVASLGMREYRKAPIPVEATAQSGAFSVPRGSDILEGKPGDYLVSDGTKSWPVDKAIFESTYTQLDDGRYVKTATIRAVQMDEPFQARSLEGLVSGEPGDWLVQGAAGEIWIIRQEKFAATYSPVEP